MTRLLVCGGRRYGPKWYVFQELDRFRRGRGISAIIHGAAGRIDPETGVVLDGADALAGEWARMHGIQELPFPAHWWDIHRPGALVKRRHDGTPYDALAGPVRNARMIQEGRPDWGMAFPGGDGTKNMVDQLRAARIRFTEIPRLRRKNPF